MRTAFALGAEIDIATTDEVRGIAEGVGESIISKMPKSRARPIRRSIPASDIMPTAGPLALNFGRPPAGYTWCLVDVVMTGPDDHTAVANATGALYIGDAQAPMLGMLLRPGQAIPGFWGFSKEVIFAHYGDDVFVLIQGAAAATQLSGVARVHQYLEDAIEAGGM